MAREQDPSDPKKPSPSDAYLKYSGLAIQLVATIGIAGWLGHWLDGYLSLKFPLFLVLFVTGAFSGVMLKLYRSLNQP